MFRCLAGLKLNHLPRVSYWAQSFYAIVSDLIWLAERKTLAATSDAITLIYGLLPSSCSSCLFFSSSVPIVNFYLYLQRGTFHDRTSFCYLKKKVSAVPKTLKKGLYTYSDYFKKEEYLSEYMKAAGWLGLSCELHYLSALSCLSPWRISRCQRSHPFILAEKMFFPDDSFRHLH